MTMTPIDEILVTCMSLIAGMIGAILGLGGGFIIVPMLVLVFGLSAQISAGTSLISIVFTGLSGVIGYAWQGRIDYKLGLSLAVASAPGAVIGSLAGTQVKSSLLTALFGCFVIAIALFIMFVKPSIATESALTERSRLLIDRHGKEFGYQPRKMPLAYALAFFAGVLAGFFGVGGGALQVPVMILLLGVPVEIATATSALVILISASTGAIAHAQFAQVAYEFLPFIIVSAVIGAQLGVQIQRRTGPLALRRMFALFLIIIGIRMILAIFV